MGNGPRGGSLSHNVSETNPIDEAGHKLREEVYANYIVVEELPLDYEPCGDCGFDHGYDYPAAAEWHTANPGSYS